MFIPACFGHAAPPPAGDRAAPPAAASKAGQGKGRQGRALPAPFAPLPPARSAPAKPPASTVPLPGFVPPVGPAPPVAPPTLPSGPPRPPAPTQPRRVSLIGGVTPAMQARAAHVSVDAAVLQGALPVLWRGTAYSPAEYEGSGKAEGSGGMGASISPSLLRLRKASGATLARINPFAAPGVVTPGADGVPIAHWQVVDAILQRAAREQADVVFVIQPPSLWSESAWTALIAATLNHYRAGAGAVIRRWELAGNAAQAPARYGAFARQSRALFPTSPLGLYLTGGDPAEGTRRVALACAADHAPLDSIGWRLPADPGAAGAALRGVHAALAAYPALKGTLLLPTLALPRAREDSRDTGARLAALCAALIEAAPSAPPNPLGGILAEDPSSNDLDAGPGMEVAPTENAPGAAASGAAGGNVGSADRNEARENAALTLALLNRVVGTRLNARSEDGQAGCLAAQSGATLRVLLWRAAGGERADAAGANAVVVMRLHHLMAGEGGLRITRRASDETAALAASAASSGTAAVNGAGEGFAADIAASGNTLPGELELTTLLAPGQACLLEIAPRAGSPPVLQTTLATAAPTLRGGDPFEVVLSARNLSSGERALDAVLTCGTPGVLPQASVRLALGTLAAVGARSFRFTLRAPLVTANSTLTLSAQSGDARALLTLPIAPALEAVLEVARADVGANGGAATLRARLVNRGRAPLNLRLRVDGGAVVSVTLRGDSGAQTVSVPALPPTAAPGLYAVRVRVESGDKTLQTLGARVGVPFACLRAQATPAIDGDLGEWTSDTPLGMGRAEQAHGKAWGGPGDISAYAYTRWDARYFYFACAVTDDVFVPARSAAMLEAGDSALFALSADGGANGRIAPDGSGNGANAQGQATAVFGMALLQNAKGGLEPVLARLFYPNGKAGRAVSESIPEGRIAVRREGSRVFYEAAIPWKRILAAPPLEGQTLGLSILVNDVDASSGNGKAGAARRGYMEWGGGLAERVQPDLFFPLRLTK